jgi:hypothetical protein
LFIDHGTTKRRQLPGPTLQVTSRWKKPITGAYRPSTTYSTPIYGTQITESDTNRWPLPKGSGAVDSGSEFYSLKCEVLGKKFPHTSLYTGAVPENGVFGNAEGTFYLANAFQDSTGQPLSSTLKKVAPVYADLSSDRAALNVKGSIAVAACNPGNQLANVASGVGELLQDVPNIPGVALWESRLKGLVAVAAGADEFLNYIFGINPTLGDMMDFLKATHKVDKRIDQFERDSGRVVRRKFHFPKERDESEQVVFNTYSPVGCTSPHGTNELLGNFQYVFPVYETVRHRVIERETWFSGAFTYYLPSWYETGNRSDRIKLTAKLLGAEPDLNTLWQLTPWSWAVDWFSNAGSFVKNVQSLISYGTILRYGYVMETTTVTDTYTAGAMTHLPDATHQVAFKPPYPAVAPVTVRTTVKKRIKANPFGFGISWDGLSTTQQAIAAALGITRAVR